MKSEYNTPDIQEVVCIKDFKEPNNVIHPCNFTSGQKYKYWTNFGGLNHIVQDDKNGRYPFRGENNLDDIDDRPLVWDYFQRVDEYRNEQINKII